MKKLSIGKFIYFLFIFLIFPHSSGKATSTLEGLLEEDVKKHHLKDGDKLDEETFNKLFPASNPQNFSQGWYCGQLASQSGGKGTGTLLKIEEKDDGILMGTGITSLHVFLEVFLGHDKKKYRYTPNWTFYQNSTSTDNQKRSYFAKIEVTKILFSSELGKDICLFIGPYILSGQYPAEVLPKVIAGTHAKLPKISEVIVTSGKTTKAILYHYPLGTLNQRENKGKLLSTDSTHKISTLAGSSGAALFAKKTGEIIGIHIGSVDGSIMGLVFEDNPNRKISVVEKNSFNVVCNTEIEMMLKGVDLHELSPNSLYSTLVPQIYTEVFLESKDELTE
ncbi:hypothetical protein IM40_06505 [Candidatus Paracaedimonas acanthamoebae]|nr:hypothetical protein IM40_06505 [Candidatus Paracaedimonas acanthamoebae]